MEFAAQKAGIRHFEFGGGARFQAPYFYVGEDPFACQDEMRRAVGPDVDLQILTRSVSGVTLTTQRLEALRLQARLMKKHGDHLGPQLRLHERRRQPGEDRQAHRRRRHAPPGLPSR